MGGVQVGMWGGGVGKMGDECAVKGGGGERLHNDFNDKLSMKTYYMHLILTNNAKVKKEKLLTATIWGDPKNVTYIIKVAMNFTIIRFRQTASV